MRTREPPDFRHLPGRLEVQAMLLGLLVEKSPTGHYSTDFGVQTYLIPHLRS